MAWVLLSLVLAALAASPAEAQPPWRRNYGRTAPRRAWRFTPNAPYGTSRGARVYPAPTYVPPANGYGPYLHPGYREWNTYALPPKVYIWPGAYPPMIGG